MTRRMFSLLWTAGLLTSVLPGCGGAAADIPELAPVSGTVTLDGEPAAGIALRFNPRVNPVDRADWTRGTGASALADQDGNYTLRHRSGQPGVRPGTYAVTFSKMAMPDGSPIPKDAMVEETGAVESLPPRYTVVDQTENVVTVKLDGDTFNFALKSK